VDDPGSLAFAERTGFRELDRQLEQVRAIGREPLPELPDEIRSSSTAERPELWEAACDALGTRPSRTWRRPAPSS
jgi:mycothiol synthase